MGSGQAVKPSKANRRLLNDLKKADKILAHGESDPEVQERYCARLIELCPRVEMAADVREIRRRLDRSTAFVQQGSVRLSYAEALATVAGKCDSTDHAMAVAAEIETVPEYSRREDLQEAGARAWFRATVRQATVRQQRLAAQRIAVSPAFAQSVAIQRAYAKTVCNTTANLIPPVEAAELIAGLERLSHSQDPEIQEAIKRSRYNLEQLESRHRERRQSYLRLVRRLTLLVLVVGTVAAAFLYVPGALASLYETEAREANTENRVYKVQLEAADTALAQGKVEEAVAHLKVIYRAARANDDELEARGVAQRLASLYDQLGDPELTVSYAVRSDRQHLLKWCEKFAAALERDMKAGRDQEALLRTEQLLRLQEAAKLDPIPVRLRRA